ncbi:hypothetical protein DEU56DRAFT_221048 [Suillus clintonianus]|uniref:uncharacterized protein n=1 Tax=Suillus clintonianus TaxID=1904413 RepID=UPI001B8709CF|nr:uncharacterized protein DEU56DRAFT_221048 [Suillus clintonianus]KAG2156120.1 hypothetical protein DEU56DRAFT_221048 [Suillus clintonianus]
MTSAVTTKFQTALPFALLSVSPGLSALHASRARSLYPEEFDPSSTTYCLRCGSYLLAADGSLELHRPRKRRKVTCNKSNALKITCHRCGFVSYTSFDRRETFSKLEPTTGAKLSLPSPIPAESVSSRSDLKSEEERTPSSSRSSVPVDLSTVAHSTRGSTSVPHARPKKKTVLQEMLARNREKEAVRTKSQQKPPPSGLASFLSILQ